MSEPKCKECNDTGIVRSKVDAGIAMCVGKKWDYVCDCAVGKEWKLDNRAEPNWEGKDLDYNATLTHFAHQLDIPLWKAMACCKFQQERIKRDED